MNFKVGDTVYWRDDESGGRGVIEDICNKRRIKVMWETGIINYISPFLLKKSEGASYEDMMI